MGVRLDMIGLVVEDISRSLDFYRLLGLPIPEPAEIEGPYYEITLDNGLRISWNAITMIRELDPDWETPVGNRIGLAYLCDDVAEVDDVHARMVGSGYTDAKAPFDAFWGQRYAQVLDPDGNLVDIFAPLPE